MDLKAELQKAREAAWVAREATKVEVKASYEHGVQDTKARLLEEVAVVCRDYCIESWGVAMDRAGVPVDSELRRAENIFLLEDIWEIPESDPPLKQLLSTQAPHPDAEIPEGAGVGKEAQPPMKDKPSEDSLIIRDVVSQAKDSESKSKADGVHSKAADPKKDPLIFFPLSCGFWHCL